MSHANGTGRMRVVVVGGGVAGAASAIALTQAGAAVTVYEAHAEPAGPVGSFVSLAANGLRALDALGCLPPVQAAGRAVERQRMWSGGGRLLGDVPRGRRSGDPLHSVTLMRADLVSVLRTEAARLGARIRTGERLDTTALERLHAADVADLIVGADGIWSATRRLLHPTAPEPGYAGLYTVSGESHGLDIEPDAFNMIFGRRGAFLHVPAPDGGVWWSAQVSARTPPDPRTVGVDDLAEIFGTEQRAVAVLRATTRVHGGTLLHTLPLVRGHHDGRIVLIGDAAHPVGAGQGASMALEDAVVLAQELGRRTTTSDALAVYDRLRGDRLGKMVKAAIANRDAKTAGPVAARLRDLIMPIVFPRMYERATGWLYDYDLGSLPTAASATAEAG
ncbi:FAD-dependent monooxygenase [Frankia sp. Mgl5]|uniref:FAD-dependent oxidoreductase n=1 Tax=Frankia sp. Mgl5 TaxID=2933793 RepID=UPI00200D41B7|nr:FAD-dependent oxidoreductase [Frankia sp. Mgl5]MCK9926257.1 FAD-dependent monooxygenase [Frankia sp. Mgl5]